MQCGERTFGKMASSVYVNPAITHSILVEPRRIVGRTLQTGSVGIETERPIERILGGYAVYFSADLPFAVDRGSGWERDRALVVVRPYQRHRLLRCHGLRTILIEPETVCPAFMEEPHWQQGTKANGLWMERIRTGFDEWERLGTIPDRSIDEIVFGQDLPPRQLDPRIAKVAEAIAASPSSSASVSLLARRAGLSESRLSHLFRAQLGIPIRSFRAWKRLRNAMALTASEPILLNAALDAGYSDEPHFSRSMRKYFGQHAHLMQRHWRSAMTFRSAGATAPNLAIGSP